MPSSPRAAEKIIRNIDIAQVSLSLQDRLGLAKLKYQHGRLHGLNTTKDGKSGLSDSDKPSDSSSTFSCSLCETPFTSPPLPSTYSKELPRSGRNKHAMTFNSRVMQPMTTASRKRARSDLDSEHPAKTARLLWKSSYELPESSPGLDRHFTHRSSHVPFMSEAPIPEVSSPIYHVPSDEENDSDLLFHSVANMNSMVGTRTPRPKQARLRRSERDIQQEDGADVLLYLTNSTNPARVAGGSHHQALPPSTPPSQHAVLGMTPNLGTPGQQFNFADFVNLTPSPAQPAWGGRTPGNPARTPLATKDARKRLNFDALVPPGTSSPGSPPKDTGLALQLGGELRP